MKTTQLTTLPALALVCALSACGGGGGGDNSASGNTGGNGSGGGGTQTYTVTASTNPSAGGAISPANAVSVQSGATATFTLTPNSGYSVASVGGTCPAGTLSGNTYTTKAITANCTVIAQFSQASASTYTVTPSVSGGGGSISPSAAVSVKSGSATSFQLTPNSGYSASVSGSCGGTLSGNTYTTKAITANCTVQVTFTQTSTGTGSVAECFKMPTAVKNYELLATNSDYPGVTLPLQVRLAPVTFMGQSATEYTLNNTLTGESMLNYLTTTNNSMCTVATNDWGATESIIVYPTPECYPFNISPGASFDFPGFTTTIPGSAGTTYTQDKSHNTFIGFATLTLSGKTFSNACHFKSVSATLDDTEEDWIASGYGIVKSIAISPDGTGKTTTTVVEFSRDR